MCKSDKPHRPKPIISNREFISKQLSAQLEYLFIKCTDPQFDMKIDYEPTMPLYKLKEIISNTHTEIDFTRYSVHMGNLELIEQTAEIKDLRIMPNHELIFKKIREVYFTNLVPNNLRLQTSVNNTISQHGIFENTLKDTEMDSTLKNFCEDIPEEETTKHEIASLKIHKGWGDHQIISPKKSAHEL